MQLREWFNRRFAEKVGHISKGDRKVEIYRSCVFKKYFLRENKRESHEFKTINGAIEGAQDCLDSNCDVTQLPLYYKES